MKKKKPIDKYLMTDEQKKLYNTMLSHVQYSADTEMKRRNRWEEIWQLWTQEKNTNIPRFRSNSRLPLLRSAVNTFSAFLSAKEPTFNVYPIGTEDWLKAQLMRELLQYQAKQVNILDLKRKMKIMIKSGALFDVGIVKVVWKTKLVERSSSEENSEKKEGNNEEKAKKYEVVYDYPCLENVNTLDFFPDPYIGRMQDQVRVVERMVIPLEELKNDTTLSIPDDFQATYTDAVTNTRDSSRLSSIDMTTGNGDAATQGKVEVWECWEKGKVYTLVDPNGTPFFARVIDNQYGFIPYVKFDFEVEPLPNRFYGYGMASPNVDINKAIDAILNNIRDNVNILINPMYKVRSGSGIDPRQLVSRPAGMVTVENMNDIDQLRTSDTTNPGFQMFSLLSGLYQNGTRVAQVRSGGTSDASTATEAEIQQQNADVVTNAVKDNFEQALSEIGTMVAKLNVQNMQGSMSVRIFNPELIESISTRFMTDKLSEEQKFEALTTGQLNGYSLDADMLREIEEYGSIKPEPMTPEEEQRIKTYGQLIKYSKRFIDVDADIIVEADSTLKKDSAIMRKQVLDTINIISRLPNGQEKIDWQMAMSVLSDLSGIPALKKLIKIETQKPTDMPSPEEMMMMAMQQKQNTGGAAAGGNRSQNMQGNINALMRPPAVDELNSEQAIRQSIRQ